MEAPLIFDPVTRSLLARGERPEGWQQRWLYVGEEAAARWLSVGSGQDFRKPVGIMEKILFGIGRERARQLAEAVLEAADAGQPFRTLVSLGPGDGRLDCDLVRSLSVAGTAPLYVAVDLSEELLKRALVNLGAETDALFGILADFETRFDFVAERVGATQSPRLYTLLGNTFGNLDTGEAAFLASVGRSLADEDRLLMSVATMGPEWSREADPHATSAGYPLTVKRFIASALAPSDEALEGPAPDTDLVGRFEARVRFRPGTSDVPAAAAVDLVDNERGRRLMSVRRYDWSMLLEWLQEDQNFEIEFEREVLYDENEAAAAVLLRRVAQPSPSGRGIPIGPPASASE